MKTWIKASIFAMLALILVIISSRATWYSMSEETNTMFGDSEVRVNYKLQEAEIISNVGEVRTEISVDYDSDEIAESDIGSVFNTTFAITMLILLLTLLFLALIILSGTKESPKMANIGLFFGFLAFLLAIILPLYFMTAVPDAFAGDIVGEEQGDTPANSFFGDDVFGESGMETSISWGGSTGWALMFLVFIFLLFAFISLIKSKSDYDLDSWRDRPEVGMPPPEMPKVEPIKIYDAEAVEPEILTIQCPSCSEKFKVKIIEHPASIECPNCKTSGEIP